MKRSPLAIILCLALALTSCRTVGRGIVRTGAGIAKVGFAPADWAENKPDAVRVIAYPVAAVSAIAGAAVGLPIMWVGAAFGGIN